MCEPKPDAHDCIACDLIVKGIDNCITSLESLEAEIDLLNEDFEKKLKAIRQEMENLRAEKKLYENLQDQLK